MTTTEMARPQTTEPRLEQRVLIAAPSGCDADVLCRTLSNAGIATTRCTNPEDLCRQMESEAAAAVLAEEFLTPDAQRRLIETLLGQPEWSDFPLIVMAAAGEMQQRGWEFLDGLNAHAHTVRLQRPVRRFTLVSSVRAALQSRARQYQVRDELLQRNRAESALRQSEERYRRLVGLLPVAVYTCKAPSGVISFYNEQAATLWGRRPAAGDTDERFCGSFRLWRPDGTQMPHNQTPMAIALRDGREFRNESVAIERPDGTRIHVLVNIDPVRDAAGQVVGAINAFHDTTELTQTQDALRESEERFRNMANITPATIWTASPDGAIRWSSDRWLDYIGLSCEDYVRNWPQVVHPDDVESCLKKWNQALADGSDYEVEVRNRRHDGRYRWFLTRATPIRDAEGRIVEWYGSTTDIHARKRAEAALREADRRKDEFLAMLAHELRNPLAPIRTGLELLKMVKNDPDTIEEIRSTMERQTQQLITLVDDLLDVSRITRGKLELRKCGVKLADIVRSALEASRPLIDEAGHVLDVDLPQQPIFIAADPNRLAQVFSNLLNNAAKYTPEGGRICLSGERLGSDVVISVSDTGIGIPADDLSRIFEMFAQIDRPPERAYTGLGIGLTLVKSLVEMHGGTVEVHSHGVNQGSTFTVQLPILVDPPAGSVAVAPADEEVAMTCQRRVLVVDDNTAAADMLSMVVKMLGNSVRTAGDGQQAIEIAAEFRPDVVLMDLGMPTMDGYEAAQRMRRQPWGEGMTLVALTGWGQDADKQRTLECGFDHHLVKPAEPADLQQLFYELESDQFRPAPDGVAR